MRNFHHIIVLLGVASCLVLSPAAQAQTTDEQLAAHYFQSSEFEKASMYYEKLYDKFQNAFYYNYLLQCHIEMQEYKKGEKLITKQMRRDNSNLTYYVDLGTLHTAAGDPSKAKQQYEKGVKALQPSRQQIVDLANAFIQKNLMDYALACYEKGRKLIKGTSSFNFEIATVLGMKGDHEGMINEYLDLLGEHAGYLQSIQNALNRTLNFMENEEKADLLKTQLLRRIQKSPDEIIFHEMLIWLFIQKKDFNSALIQTKALDKRQKEWGERVKRLGQLCASNQAYNVAVKCYEYVIELGPKGYYYQESKIELLEVLNQRVTASADYTSEDLLNLEGRYQESLAELGKSAGTATMMKDYAHLQAFYLDKMDDAIALLEEARQMGGLSQNMRGHIKLELADIMLLNGDIWDASLYYGQVDKAFKHDILGHEAKFRNAKIFFYTGEFEWAQAQLDVLKSSTSKLIANDAMDLSLLITDNLNLDTTLTPMMMYSRADLLMFQHKYDEANLALDSLMAEYPGHTLKDEVHYLKYKIHFLRGEHDLAIQELQRIISFHGDDILGDNAMFNLAEMYHYKLKDLEKAQESYEKLIMDYPGSLYVVEARKRYRNLAGNNFDNDGFEKID
jgi:tetratricopeptide (TPR) repeat protein